jgi:hypothetical protein
MSSSCSDVKGDALCSGQPIVPCLPDCLPPRAPNYTPYASRFGPGRARDREVPL